MTSNGVYVLDMLDKYKIRKDAKILDVGCGDGSMIMCLKEHGYNRVSGCDVDGMSDYGDAENLPYRNNSFDVIIMCHVLEHVDNPVRALSEAKRVSKGIIVVLLPNFSNLFSRLYFLFTGRPLFFRDYGWDKEHRHILSVHIMKRLCKYLNMKPDFYPTKSFIPKLKIRMPNRLLFSDGFVMVTLRQLREKNA